MVSSRAVGPDQLASACSPTPSPRWLGLNDNHNVQLPPLHPSRESFSAQGNQQSQGVTLNGGVRHSSLGRAVPPPERMRMVVQEQNQRSHHSSDRHLVPGYSCRRFTSSSSAGEPPGRRMYHDVSLALECHHNGSHLHSFLHSDSAISHLF